MFLWLKGKIRNVDGAIDRQREEKLYQIVLKEIESGARRDGLWAKALTLANFDDGKAKSEYVKLRMQSIVDEEVIAEQRKEQEVARLHERAKQLASEGYMRKEFETWFLTTTYTHRQYDREYQKYLLACLAKENGEAP